MQYMVMIKQKSGYFHDSLLAENKEFDSIMADNCEEIGLCETCAQACDMNQRCHILRRIRKNTWDKLCPILFCDAVKPPFKPEDLL